MKTLSVEEMMMVSGAGNYADKHGMGNPKGSSNSNNNGNPRYNDPGVANCNKAILIGGILGAAGGGAVGAALGIAGAALGSDCSTSSSSNNNSGSRNGSSSIGGQCRW
jgi:hypothetical protein